MVRINKKALLVYAITVFAFVVFFFVTNQQTPKNEVMINSNIQMQKRIRLLEERLRKIEQPSQNKREKTATEDHNLSAQENPQSVTTIKKEDKETQKQVVNFMKFIQQQMASLSKTVRGLPPWNEHDEFNRKLRETFHRSPLKKALPVRNVTQDDITLDCETEYDVVFLVTSYAGNFDRRAWIRDSWGASKTWLTKKNWKVIFNVGTVNTDATIMNKVKNESTQFKDVLCLDVPESFHKLSERVMVALKWTYQRAKFNFILKTDDDIFIHVDRVIKVLANEYSHEDFIGNVMYNQPPSREKGRYFVSKEEWPGELYDPYCSGGGFILSNAIIGKMIPHFSWSKPLKIDDAYVGHLVKQAGGRPLHTPDRFLMWNDKGQYDDKFFVSHPVKTARYRDFLMSKALIEMGKVQEQGHKYENMTSLKQYNEMVKNRTKF